MLDLSDPSDGWPPYPHPAGRSSALLHRSEPPCYIRGMPPARKVFVAAAAVVAALALRPNIAAAGRTKAEIAAALRKDIAARSKTSEDSFPCRFTAAALAEKADPEGAVESKMHERVGMIIGIYKQLDAAVMDTKLPDAYKAQVMKEYGRRFMWPIRQGPPRMGVGRLSAMVKGLPAESMMITIEPGKTLAQYIQTVYPDFAKLSPLRQMLVYDGLDEVNPLIMPLGSFLADAGKGDGVPGARRVQVGPELEPIQMYFILYEIDPSLRLVPKEVEEAHKDLPQGELLAVPIGDGKMRVRRYRIPVGAEVLIPTAAYMAALANPKKLDLRNAWLRDLSSLSGLTPEELDLAGCDATDLKPLSGITSLRRLSLYSTPVSDLAPLRGLQLTHLNAAQTRVADLTPLKGMKLEHLDLRDTGVTDLSPLKGMPIAYLNINHTAIDDLAPVVGMPLTYLQLNIATRFKSFMMLGDIESLKNIGDVPLETWFKEYEAYQNPATRPGDKDAPPDDCEPPPKKAPVVVPKPPPKPKAPDPKKPPKITDDIDLDLGL